MKYRVTTYSSADGEEHVFETDVPITVAEYLAGNLEIGSWFKIERIEAG